MIVKKRKDHKYLEKWETFRWGNNNRKGSTLREIWNFLIKQRFEHR